MNEKNFKKKKQTNDIIYFVHEFVASSKLTLLR